MVDESHEVGVELVNGGNDMDDEVWTTYLLTLHVSVIILASGLMGTL